MNLMACQCGNDPHTDGCDGVLHPTYTRTGLRLKLHEPPYVRDLDTFDIASAAVSEAAHQLRLASVRLKRAAEERERACLAHTDAMRAFDRARNEFAIQYSKMELAERGEVLPELRALPLPEVPS